MDTRVLHALKTFIQVAKIEPFGSREMKRFASPLLIGEDETPSLLELRSESYAPIDNLHLEDAARMVAYLRTGNPSAAGNRHGTQKEIVTKLQDIVEWLESNHRGDAQNDGRSELDSQYTKENSRTNFILFNPLTEDSLDDLVKRVAFELHVKSDQIKSREVKQIDVIRKLCTGKKDEERLRSALDKAIIAGKIYPSWK